MSLTRRNTLIAACLAAMSIIPAGAEEPEADRLAPLSERLERLEALVERLEREAVSTREELDEATSRQQAAAVAESQRRERAAEIDRLITEAAQADLQLMAGQQADTALESLQADCARLAEEAEERSGRLEYDAARAAVITLESARRALANDDWLLARSLLAGAADALAQARVAITGNAQPNWLER